MYCCQELPPDIGEALCELLDGQDALYVNLKMYSSFLENLNSARSIIWKHTAFFQN